MNIVLLSPYFPPNYYHFAVALRQNSVNVLGLGDASYGDLRFELRSALTEYYAELDLYYYSLRELPRGLEDAGRRAVAAFNLRERFFHIEFFHLGDAHWVALEVNMRPPGGLTMDMFNYANDIDLYREWANIVAFGRSQIHFTRPYHCAYVGRRRMRTYRLSHAEVLHRYGDLIPEHGPMSEVLAPALGHYAYLFRSPDLDRLRQVIADVLAV